MRLSTHVGYGDGFLKSAGQIVKLEEVGLDVVWMAEVYGSDAATRLGFLAARTHRIELGAAIFPIYSRTPALLAQTAAGRAEIEAYYALAPRVLDELAPHWGRLDWNGLYTGLVLPCALLIWLGLGTLAHRLYRGHLRRFEHRLNAPPAMPPRRRETL